MQVLDNHKKIIRAIYKNKIKNIHDFINKFLDIEKIPMPKDEQFTGYTFKKSEPVFCLKRPPYDTSLSIIKDFLETIQFLNKKYISITSSASQFDEYDMFVFAKTPENLNNSSFAHHRLA